MSEGFPGTSGKVFFLPNPDGAAVVEIDGAQFVITNLQPLPAGSQYQLMIDGTPVPGEDPGKDKP